MHPNTKADQLQSQQSEWLSGNGRYACVLYKYLYISAGYMLPSAISAFHSASKIKRHQQKLKAPAKLKGTSEIKRHQRN